MTTTRRHCLDRKAVYGRGGFTLVEMLVVIAIIALLAVLALPSVKGVLGSMDMRGGANIVMSQLELARQTATTRNVQVEVRFYQDATITDPHPNAANSVGGTGAFRIIAIAIPSSNPGVISDEYISSGIQLPGDTVCDATPAYSTLLDPTQNDASGNSRQVSATATTQDPSPPTQLKSLPYMKLTYLPNGTMNLSPTGGASTTAPGVSGNWCLSMRSLHAAPVTVPHPAPASNYVTMVLDPTTSRARIYQP